MLFLDHNFTGGCAGVGATTADATTEGDSGGSALCIKSLSAAWPNPPDAEDSNIPQDSRIQLTGGGHHPDPATDEDGKTARWRGFTDVSLDVDFGQIALVMGPVGAGTLDSIDFWTSSDGLHTAPSRLHDLCRARVCVDRMLVGAGNPVVRSVHPFRQDHDADGHPR